MNNNLLQNLRYKLQKRFRRLNSSNPHIFGYSLRQFWGFLNGHDILVAIMTDLKQRFPNTHSELKEIIKQENVAFVCDDELEGAAAGLFAIIESVKSENNIPYHLGAALSRSDTASTIEAFVELYVEPLYEYLDEQLDDQRIVLALLIRYKHKCEWFRRDELYGTWDRNTGRGERLLALNLYEYLYDQGLEFSIEPHSISGEADLVAAQSSDDPLIADVKIFNPERGKGQSYLSHAVHQIYDYMQDYNQECGFLVIFKTCEPELKFVLKYHEQAVPFLMYNHKTIFLITIDIFPHEHPASKRGELKGIEITEGTLTGTLTTKK